ncbi:MAG TPA: hypothetical protein VHQ22_20110 [Terriglobales bacterium]|jgi:hypothetical protein|nr:hypothetical protein [Terriglobales bacterium]
MGVRQAGVYAQRAATSQGQKLTEPGDIGPKSSAVINAMDSETFYALCQLLRLGSETASRMTD